MTLIQCNKHGTSEFFESCEHAEKLIDSRELEKIRDIRAYLYRLKVCDHCINEYNLSKYIILDPENFDDHMNEPDPFWESLEIGYEKMENRKAWCALCFQEAVASKNT